MKFSEKIAILKPFLYNKIVLCKHLRLFGGYNVRHLLKKLGKRALTLLLMALLCFAAPMGVLAEEDVSVEASSSVPESGTAEPGETSSALPEEEPEESDPSPEDEASSAPAEAPVESEQESEGAGAQENKETTFAADSLLVLGGHETYMKGCDNAMFKPGNAMTRAEVAQMLYALLVEKPAVTESQFSDVNLSSWYGVAVNTLAKAKVLTGYTDGTFAPNKAISRAEFVTVMTRCFHMPEGTATFSDVSENYWAYDAISAAATAGWVNGVGNTGQFQPNRGIQRCEAVKVVNTALKRKDENFAKDRDTQKFRDVPKSHWAYLEIAEAAQPIEPYVPHPPIDDPVDGEYKAGQLVRVTANGGLNLREQPNTDCTVLTVLGTGTILTVTGVPSAGWLGVKTSNGTVGYVSAEYVEHYTPGAASGAKLSATTLSLRQYQTARLDASVDSGMSSMSWTSSDPSVAVVGYSVSYGSRKQGAMVYGKKPGTTTLTFSDAAGKNKVTCKVTVAAPESVRYAYAGENSAIRGKNFDLIAVTDAGRTSVTFTITAGPAKGTYSTTSYTTESRRSEYGLPTNTVRVFKKTVAFSAAGTYTVRATANGASDYKDFTVFVRANEESANTTAAGERRATTQGLCLVANFEGLVEEIEDDVIASGNPTVGYGYVVPVNTSFYNNLTKAEAFAMLVDKANNGGYSAGVNRFRQNNNVKMSQAQFDALLSFVWNCGTGTLDASEYDTPKVMLNAVVPPSDLSESRPYSGTLRVGSSPIYKEASRTSGVLTTVKDGSTVSVTGAKGISSSHQVWYKVKYGNYTGWMPAGKVTLSATGLTRDLAYADAGTLSNNFMQWHKSGGCVYGLLTRRLAECKVFFFGNYTDAFHNYVDLGEGKQYVPSPNYEKNTYGFVFPDCCKRYENN